MSGIPPVYAGFGAAEDGPNDVPIKEQPSSLHRRSQSRGLIDGVDVVLAEPSLGGHRRTHSQGLIVDTHEGETVRTGSTSNMGLKKDDNHSPGSRAAAHFVSAEKEKGQTEKEQCWERIKQRYPNYDHYCPSTQGWSIFMTGFALIFSAIVALFVVLDQYVVPGFRMVPIGLLLYYVVYNGVRLLVVVEWTISRTTRRGLQFQPRMGVPQTRAALVAKLRERLQRSMASRPPLTRKPKIIVSIGFGGGGHEATVKGVMDVMTEAGFSTEIVEIPVGFLVETDDKNPVWNLTGCTGEQIYNWGLKKSEWVAFCIMWLLSLAQAAALTLDKFAGFFGQLINADYGDEAARVCERVWREHNPDMVLNFCTGIADTMIRGLSRAQLAQVPLVVVVSDFEGRGAHSWIENKAQYAVCGTSICRQQALDFGLPTSHVYQTSGMILRPSFYEPDQDASRSAADRKVMIGLDPDRRTVLVFWGGVGSSKVLDIGLRIRDGAREKLNVIFLCGRNAALMEQLNRVAWGDTRVCVQGFTQRVSFYMQLSDMIVCKPGPGVCSEAALLGVPIIVQYSVFTLPQEVAVCKWVLNRGLGLGFARLGQLVAQVNRMLDMLNSGGNAMQQQLQRPVAIAEKGLSGFDLNPADNAAVFEVPAIVQDILDANKVLAQPPGPRGSPGRRV